MPKLLRESIKSHKFKKDPDSHWILECKTNLIDIKNNKIKYKLKSKACIKDINKDKLITEWALN